MPVKKGYMSQSYLPFYFSIPFKIFIILSRLDFKVSFKTVNNIKLSSSKDLIVLRTCVVPTSFLILLVILITFYKQVTAEKPGWMSVIVKNKVKRYTALSQLLTANLIILFRLYKKSKIRRKYICAKTFLKIPINKTNQTLGLRYQ